MFGVLAVLLLLTAEVAALSRGMRMMPQAPNSPQDPQQPPKRETSPMPLPTVGLGKDQVNYYKSLKIRYIVITKSNDSDGCFFETTKRSSFDAWLRSE
jgi:hypothetical protein